MLIQIRIKHHLKKNVFAFNYLNYFHLCSIQQSKDDVDVCIQNLSDLFIKLVSGDGKWDIVNKLMPELLKVYFHSTY